MSKTNVVFVIDVYSSFHSFGLLHDLEVISYYASRRFGENVLIRRIDVSFDAFNSIRVHDNFPESLGKPGDMAIFLEHAFIADFLYKYKERAFFINPEWFTQNDGIASDALVNTFLHKTRHYHSALKPVLTKQRHVYTGFTSIDPGVKVNNYTSFSHFRGLSWRRLTQDVIEVWRQNALLPLLRVHAYGDDIAVNTNAWVGTGNMQFYFGKLERDVYFRELAQGGIHLCTTKVEGFGHFVNEARAMSALTIVLDGAPMNEIITPDTGILVPTSDSRPQFYGTVYSAEPEEINHAIDRALRLPVAERERMGRFARTQYEQQAEEFRHAFCDYLQPFVDEALGLP